MSRAIKFRAWDNKEKAFVTEYDTGEPGAVMFRGSDKPIATWKELTCTCSPEGCGGCDDVYIDTDDIEVMQWTGLTDKNGVEVFEGDIVSITEVDYEAIEDWEHDDPRWEEDELPQREAGKDVVELDPEKRTWLRYEQFGYEGEKLVSPGNCLVIGNVFENPELLNDQPN